MSLNILSRDLQWDCVPSNKLLWWAIRNGRLSKVRSRPTHSRSFLRRRSPRCVTQHLMSALLLIENLTVKSWMLSQTLPSTTRCCLVRSFLLISGAATESCSLDPIPTDLVKFCANELAPFIHPCSTNCWNVVISLRFFVRLKSHQFSRNQIWMLWNGKTTVQFQISNLNNISKLLERLFLTRFQPHISNSPNFNPLQSAYRKFHSTETSLLNTLDQVYTAADSSQPTVLVSLDLSAAFDTIDHHILLSRLQVVLLAGSAHIWRAECNVLFWDSHSNTSLSTGDPQGSVLGPLLFSIFTSPVGHIISSSGVQHQQYADDTQLFISLSPANLSESIKCLECCLLRLHEWFCLNGLALNPDKSEAIWLSTHQRSHTTTALPIYQCCWCWCTHLNQDQKHLA